MGAPGGVPPVLRYGDRRLRSRCDETDLSRTPVRELADLMWRTLHQATGVALAAPQIGCNERLVVINDPRSKSAQRLVMVNPVIEKFSGPLEHFEEGCLSFPGLYFHLRRHSEIRVAYQNLEGRKQQMAAGGLLARIVQHEVDHLDGILFIDHLAAWRRWLLVGRLWMLKLSRER